VPPVAPSPTRSGEHLGPPLPAFSGIVYNGGNRFNHRRISMTKRIVVALLLAALSLAAVTGCYQTGKIAGEGVKETKEGASDMKQGYKEGVKQP
jgi:hypothetical protein